MATVLHDFVFKYIIIGDVSVGKSSFLYQFKDNKFSQECEPTVCVEFNSKIVQVNGKRFKLQVWDTSGQDRFRDIAKTYYRGSACMFLMYDVTKRSTFEHINGWLQDALANGTPGTTLVLLANKCEPGAVREVTTEEGEEFARQAGMLFYEVSAKTGHGVQNAFVETTRKVFESFEGDESAVLKMQDSPMHSNSLLDKEDGLPKNTTLGSLENAYSRLSLYTMFCVSSNQKSPRLSVRLCVLPWQILGRVLMFCLFMALEILFILPCMFLILVQRPREVEANKPQSLNDSVDSLPEPDNSPISFPLFVLKSVLSLLLLLVYPLLAIYYVVPIYIIKPYPEILVKVLVALEVLVLTILLIFGIVRRLQKRKSALQLSRTEEIKLNGPSQKFQWINFGNWIVIGFLVLELLQIIGFPLSILSQGVAKGFSIFYLFFSGSGVKVTFWLSITCVFGLLGVINMQLMADLRSYLALRKQGKIEEASSSFYFSFFGSVIFGHGKPDNISKLVRYTVMILSDGLFFLLITQFINIFACNYVTFSSELHSSLIVNPDIKCWNASHYTMAFFSLFSLGYYTLFSGLVSPVLVEGGVTLDIHFHGIYTTAINIVKLVFVYFVFLYSPATPSIFTLASCVSGPILGCVTVTWMLRTSTPMRQPSSSAGANVFRAGTFGAWGLAGGLAYACVELAASEGVRLFVLLTSLSIALAGSAIWFVRYTKKRTSLGEFSQMQNADIYLEEGSEMDRL